MLTSIILILNLFFLETLLSVDNAAVLALMVKPLPERDRPHALKYGLLGAFCFRGMFLVMVSWLVKILWLKIAGGCYLIYLAIGHFTPKRDTLEEGVKQDNKAFAWIKKHIGVFWGTVVMVEIMDIAFSIDNIFAAVAFTDKLLLIIIGVFMGIVAMRFVASWFCKLLEKHKSLETSAFIVIALLGIKLVISGVIDYFGTHSDTLASLGKVIGNHTFDFSFSAVMMLIFFLPLIFTRPKPTSNAVYQK